VDESDKAAVIIGVALGAFVGSGVALLERRLPAPWHMLVSFVAGGAIGGLSVAVAKLATVGENEQGGDYRLIENGSETPR